MPDLNPELADAMVQKSKCTAVEGTPHQHFIAGSQQGPEGGCDSAHARRQCKPRLATFQRGHALLQHRQGGIGDTTIKMPPFFTGKTGRTVFNSREGEGCGLVHRRHQRPLIGQRVVAMVDGTGSKT
ncbi:hypothetical protein D3C76_1186830 [compost metagenome]